ncbi:MAG: metal ABC transporter substrate-binding protein [Luteolibacter sp.]|jgi:zinc/manganese transport system substrate-binding protein
MHVPRMLIALLFSLTTAWSSAEIKVSALHPLMADLARQVGGDRVKVFDLVGEGGDPHRFEPRPSDMRNMQASALILAGGKNLETYLDRIRASLPNVPILEVGRTIPSLTVGKDAVYTCCPHHAYENALDPHWWHGIDNMRRAARVVADAFAEVDPGGRDHYQKRARDYARELADLKSWARRELAKVPRGQRKLVTAHNAFAYFAKEFGFEVIAVAGLNKEQESAPQDLARTIESVRNAGVPAIFPEYGANPKALESVARATGAKLAPALVADGNGSGDKAGFKPMIHHNVNTIVRALAGE